MSVGPSRALDLFSAPARAWFEAAFAEPTPVQDQGWRAVASGGHTLMTAPTGSGKTLAAFFWCLDRLFAEPEPAAPERCRVLYVSPLKALTVDVERNLRAPLQGLTINAARLGLPTPEISAFVRTGDTPASERRQVERRPPDILITTPESLYLILTSAARRMVHPVRWVIVDEIHSVAGNKRGAHLALTLERLEAITASSPQRIGLSATQKPLEEIAHFLVGAGRDCQIVDAGGRKTFAITVEIPVEDMANLDRGADETAPSDPLGNPRPPRRSIWPAIHPRLLELIREHRSTIVFVNSRRLAERLAAKLNELAGEEDFVRAHHGSIAKEQRAIAEDALKAGTLRALVATSSLELGIDMGAVDLVVQVEAPPSVAAGIQRIGRAGHSVGETSRGTIMPNHRADLLEAAAVVEGMLEGRIETTVIPSNPLDVLAQQVVAMAALDQWSVDDIGRLVRRAYPFRDLGERTLEAVLDMLGGRYPADELASLRPRIVWDRVAGTVRARAGAQRLAVTSGGTIPDRGLYTVNLLEDGRRVGELDEEMVYEIRPGEAFVLGATTWRVADITPAQVLVTPAPGEPARVAFWHGDSPFRPPELGRAIGRLVRELREAGATAASQRLAERAGLDERARTNLLAYLRDQEESSGAVPDDRTIVVERFRDEVGDWRVCLLSPMGSRVHAPWALAIRARLRDRLMVEVEAMHTDDGVVLRFPEADSTPEAEEYFFPPEEVRDLVTQELQSSALFASRFRENAARSLLLPRRRPGERTPLWLQRKRSHDLLQVASGYPDFPIVLETYRECLVDVFDLDALSALMGQVRARQVRVAAVDTERASPFASSLMFAYIAQNLYEGDSPLAERRAQALTLDLDLLAELLGSEELQEMLDPEVIAALEIELQGLEAGRRPRDPDEAVDLVRWLGDLTEEEILARGVEPAWLADLASSRRLVRVRIAGDPRWIAAEDAGRYAQALGVAIPPGLPTAYLEPVPEPLPSLVLRWARTHVPFMAIAPGQRWGLDLAALEPVLDDLVRAGRLVAGRLTRSVGGEAVHEYCHPEVLRLLRRRTLAELRREIEPVSPETMAAFLPSWQGVGSRARGLDRLYEIVEQLEGLPVPVSVLERDVLPARMDDYSPALLDQLITGGEIVWVGRGAIGSRDGRIAFHLRSAAARLLAVPVVTPDGPLAEEIRARLESRGALFFHELRREFSAASESALLEALWTLVWAGEVTNDSFAPVRAAASGGTNPRTPRSRPGRQADPRTVGRWSLVRALADPSVSSTVRLHAEAETLLRRHGILFREAVLAEGWPGGFAALYPVLRTMEERGQVRRGYFVEGLGGSQFARPGAVDRLRSLREEAPTVQLLAAADPANPYGATLPWPPPGPAATRSPGAYVVLESGFLRLHLERGGHSLRTFGEVGDAALRALAEIAERRSRLEIRLVDGTPVHESPWAPRLRATGFGTSPRGLIRYSK